MARVIQHSEKSEKTENIVALVVFAVFLLVIVGIFTKGFGFFEKNTPVGLGEQINVPYDNDPIRGNLTKDSVVIFIFSDFECPYCKKGEDNVQAVFEKYQGKVVLIFKNLPLTGIHPSALGAALAAECANEQGKFWEYHDYLFNHQNALTVPDLKAYATEIGLDSVKFNMCLDSQKYKFSVEQDAALGKQLGVSGTPTFFVDGYALVGAQPVSEFEKIINLNR